MKKIIMLLLSTFPVILLAQSEWAAEISYVHPRFCKDRVVSTRLSMWNVPTWNETEICIAALNNSDHDINILWHFVDSSLNEQWNVACGNLEDEKKGFWAFAYFPVNTLNGNTQVENKLNIVIKPWETIERRAAVKFPNSFNWVSTWCLITEIGNRVEVQWKLNVNTRRWSVISANVVWEPKIDYNFSANLTWIAWDADAANDILFSKDNVSILKDKASGVYYLNTLVSNSGNVPLQVVVNSDLVDMLGNNQQLVSTGDIAWGETKQLSVEISEMPIYLWKFDLKQGITLTPNYWFDAANYPDSLKTPRNENYATSIMIIPYTILTWIAWVLVLLIVLIVIKRKWCCNWKKCSDKKCD